MEIAAKGLVSKTANITSHDFSVHSIALSSDARIVAAGSYGGVTITELADDLSVVRHIRLKGHRGDVHLLRFSTHDGWLLSGGEDNRVHVYPVDANQVFDLACIVAGRPLSESEGDRLGESRLSNVGHLQLKH
jgi:WD40 repeat protein